MLFQLLNLFTHVDIQFTVTLVCCVSLSCVIVYVCPKLGYVFILHCLLSRSFSRSFNISISHLNSLLIANQVLIKVYDTLLSKLSQHKQNSIFQSHFSLYISLQNHWTLLLRENCAHTKPFTIKGKAKTRR